MSDAGDYAEQYNDITEDDQRDGNDFFECRGGGKIWPSTDRF